MVRQVGVERDRVALAELVRDAVADEAHAARQHHGRLAAARLVHRRVAGPAGGGARRQRVQRHLGALPGQRRRQHLVAVAVGVAAEQPLAGAHDA